MELRWYLNACHLHWMMTVVQIVGSLKQSAVSAVCCCSFFCVRRICCAWVNDWDQNRCVVKRARARMTWPPHTNCRIWAMNSVGYYFNLIECAAQNEIKTDQTTGTGSANKRIKIFNWNTRRVSNQTRFGINKKETPIWTCDALQLNIIYFLLNHSKCREYVGFFSCVVMSVK